MTLPINIWKKKKNKEEKIKETTWQRTRQELETKS